MYLYIFIYLFICLFIYLFIVLFVGGVVFVGLVGTPEHGYMYAGRVCI